MTLAEKIERLEQYGNEIAFGYNDSGCFWHLHYGPRGTGNMLQGFGKELSALETDGCTFEEAVDYFLSQLIAKHGERVIPAS